MYEALERLFAALAADHAARAVIIASALPGIFMAGADLNEFLRRDNSKEALRAHLSRIHSAFGAVSAAAMPVIAAIEGHAMGGGCELALCCDFRIMARGRPRIGLPEITLGLMPGGGGTQRLPRLVGRQAASRIAFLGDRLDADQAEAIGLVQAVDAGEALPAARELAGRLAEQAPEALRRIKLALAGGLAGSLADGLALEQALAIETSGGEEAKEGVSAFLEKRGPRWRKRQDG
jgi:enoyl-CoA hydratase/carnithine racemase